MAEEDFADMAGGMQYNAFDNHALVLKTLNSLIYYGAGCLEAQFLAGAVITANSLHEFSHSYCCDR